MQDQNKKNKKDRKLIYKPYLKGNLMDGAALKQSLKLLLFFLMFAFLYVVAGSALQLSNGILRILANLLLVAACGAILMNNGARLGESEVAYGEIAYARKEAGKPVEEKEKERCFHPMKGVMIALAAAVPLILLTLPYALTAQKQTYILQVLPTWVGGYGNQSELSAPLAYYQRSASLSAMDMLRMVNRILILPFANIATTENQDALLVMDHLSPLLACLPLVGFPAGYMMGPRNRAMIHGDISSSNKRYQRRQRKAVKARQARTEKKNELI